MPDLEYWLLELWGDDGQFPAVAIGEEWSLDAIMYLNLGDAKLLPEQ